MQCCVEWCRIVYYYANGMSTAIPVPDPRIEKNTKLIVYDPSMDDYSTEQPELIDLDNGHMVFGTPGEIEQYRIKRSTT